MKNLSKNLFWAVITLLFVSTIFSALFSAEAVAPATLSINELAKQISDGAVKSIVVDGNDLKITLKDDKTAVARKENEASFLETISNYGISKEALQKVEFKIQEESGMQYWASILLPILLPVIFTLLIFWFIFRQAKTGMNQAFSFGKANVKIFSHFKDKISFKDVAGLKEAKQELMEVVDFLKNPKKYIDIGAKIPRGVLLLGYPGTGKTLLARAVAGEAGVPFFHISGSEFVEMFVGVGSSRVRDLFDTAKKAAPCIIFIDEIDAIGRERGSGIGGGHDEREQTLNQILVEMDGFERNTKVIVIAATNRGDILDPALLRPGRFDRRVILDLPDINDREEILKIHIQGKPLEKNINLKSIATRTPGFSGADLANLINEAAITAARRNNKTVEQDDIINSIEKVMLGPARQGRAISVKEKEITAYHEAGHALVASAMKDSDPVHKVSIISRGMAGGYTIKLPTEERRLKTRTQFIADLAVSFGGFAAEEATFKDVSTGSQSDLQHATEMAHKIVMRYGMSRKLGPRTFGKAQEMVFLGREISSEKDYSEKISVEIDEEINEFINKSFEAARGIVARNKPLLDKIAKTLLEKESIEQEEFAKIVKSFNLRSIVVK